MAETARGEGVHFPLPYREFARAVTGTSDEVFLTLLRIQHGRERHTLDGWRDLLESYRHMPAYRRA